MLDSTGPERQLDRAQLRPEEEGRQRFAIEQQLGGVDSRPVALAQAEEAVPPALAKKIKESKSYRA